MDGGDNTYAYALQNPVRRSDPLGLRTPGFRPLTLPRGAVGYVQGIRVGRVRDARVRRALASIDGDINAFRASLAPCEVGFFTLCWELIQTPAGPLVQNFVVEFRKMAAAVGARRESPGKWVCVEGQVVGRMEQACCTERDEIPRDLDE
jgi:hypothetical protein